MNDFESLKKSWKTVRNDSARIPDPTRPGRVGKRLRRRFSILIIVALELPLIAISLHHHLGVSLWVCAAYGLFGLIMACLTAIIYRDLNSKKYLSLTVVEATEYVRRIVHKRSNFRIAGIIMMIPLLATILYEFYFIDKMMFWSSVIGAVTGLIIGLSIEFRILRDFNRLLESISSDGERTDGSDAEL